MPVGAICGVWFYKSFEGMRGMFYLFVCLIAKSNLDTNKSGIVIQYT